MSEEEHKKKPIHCEWYRKPWYKDYDKFDSLDPLGPGYAIHQSNFDNKKYSAYKSNKGIITALSKKKYGVILSGNFLYIKKVVGGVMINGEKAKTIEIVVNLNKIKSKSLSEQLIYIDNLFNNK